MTETRAVAKLPNVDIEGGSLQQPLAHDDQPAQRSLAAT